MFDEASDQNLDRTIADYFSDARDDHEKIMSLFAFTPDYSQANVRQCLRYMLYECPLKNTRKNDIAFFLMKHVIRNRDMLPSYEKDAIHDLNKRYGVMQLNHQITEANYTLKQTLNNGTEFNVAMYDPHALDLLRIQYIVETRNSKKRNTTSKLFREYATTLAQLVGSENSKLNEELFDLSDDMLDRYRYAKERIRNKRSNPPMPDM